MREAADRGLGVGALSCKVDLKGGVRAQDLQDHGGSVQIICFAVRRARLLRQEGLKVVDQPREVQPSRLHLRTSPDSGVSGKEEPKRIGTQSVTRRCAHGAENSEISCHRLLESRVLDLHRD